MNEYLVGMDIGTSKICAAVGKVDRQGQLQIIGITSVGCTGLKKGVVVDIDSTSDAIRNCIEQLERMVDIEISNVYISLPGGLCEIINSKGVVAVSSDDREIRESDVDRVLKAARVISIPSDKAIIDVIPEQFIVDGFENIKDPVGMSGLRLEVDAQIVIAQATVVNNLCKSVSKAGLEIEGIVLEPLVVSQVVMRKDELAIGTALVDVGAETTDIAIYKGGNLIHKDSIPLGGNTITNDIAVCLKIPYTEAEKIKIKYGAIEKSQKNYGEKIKVNASYNDVVQVDIEMLTEIIEARVEEIIIFIGKKLYDSGYFDQVSGIVLVGGGLALYKGIEEFARNILNKSIRIGTPEYVGASNPTYSAAVGIVKDILYTIKLNDPSEALNEDSSKAKPVLSSKNHNKEENSVISKIKGFFVDFF